MQRLLFILIPVLSFSQTNTEVFIAEIENAEESYNITEIKNISKNKGYDNQPSFYSNTQIIYTGNNNGQTDIFEFNTHTNKKKQLNKTTSGGEYSPQRIPKTNDIAAVRLDTTGLQRLYKYDYETGDSSLLIHNLKVGYYTFYNATTIVSAVLNDNHLDLVVSDVTHKTNDTISSFVGRTICKVPNTDNISYSVLNEDKNQDIYLLDMKTLESFFVCELPIGVEDFTWIDENKILIGSNSSLFVYDLFGSQKWEEVINLKTYKIKNITRLAVSPSKNKIAIVAEVN
jgi:hypothetical protein